MVDLTAEQHEGLEDLMRWEEINERIAEARGTTKTVVEEVLEYYWDDDASEYDFIKEKGLEEEFKSWLVGRYLASK